jgi:uncharacterized sporulation protein YeaH/YhbH (DUF444 family)
MTRGYRISSSDSEGAFEDFIQDSISESVEELVNGINDGTANPRGGDVIIEVDDIYPPTFVYGNDSEGEGGGGRRPGQGGGKLRFSIPLHKLMAQIAEALGLPNLVKDGAGKIKEESEVFRTISRKGKVLDKKRTFRQALKSSIAMGLYDPEDEKDDIYIRKRDKRYKQTRTEERPKFKAVVMYVGDVSYSTAFKNRLELEKRLVNFIQGWTDYNYGVKNVEHRFFVHHVDCEEVSQQGFYEVSHVGGTYACPAFKNVCRVAIEDYDLTETNFYLFYFGDGELWGDDAEECAEIINEDGKRIFQRIGITEVEPSGMSCLVNAVEKHEDDVVRTAILNQQTEIVEVIKSLFAGGEPVDSSHEFTEGAAI